MRLKEIHNAFQLGISLAVIYVPLRIYMNTKELSWVLWKMIFPLWIVELMISIVFYSIWILFIRWLQSKIIGIDPITASTRFWKQMIVLGISVGLAILFNIGFGRVWAAMESFWLSLTQSDVVIKSFHPWQVNIRANNSLTILALLNAYYLTINTSIRQKLQDSILTTEILEKENIKANFQALKNQVSPHFFFNNLSVLSHLVEKKSDNAVEFIRRLSLTYRYILEQANLDEISLKKEIEFLHTYFFLLKTRFNNKIILDVNVTEFDQSHFKVIPLTLQILCENAVKHNQLSIEKPLKISIFIKNSMLVVQNPLQPRANKENTTGLGLNNITSRYQLLSGKPVIIQQIDNHFIVGVPLQS